MWHTTRPFYTVPILVFRPRPDDPNRASGEGLDGRRPPIFDRCRGQPMGLVWHQVWHLVWHTNSPAWGGSLPSVFIPAGRLPGPRAGRTIRLHRAARYVTHSYAPSLSSAASAQRAPGRGRACSPRPTPWPCSSATTRRTYYAAGRCLVLRRARRGRVPHGPISHQHVADPVRPDGRQCGAPVEPSHVAAFAYGGRPGDRRL